MSADLDLAAIRARHADGERVLLSWPQEMARQAHADRGALLAALDAMTRERDAYAESMREEIEENVTLFGLLRVGPDIEAGTAGTAAVTRAIAAIMVRADAAQAALDRLAAVTVEEIAQAIAETRGPSPSGVGTVWHGVPWATANQATYRAMAAAVLTLLHARLDGPCPRTRPA